MPKSKSTKSSNPGQDEVMDDEPVSNDTCRLPGRQDPDTRRQIRHEYRNLAESIRENQHDLVVAESEALQKKLEECNTIFKNVVKEQELQLVQLMTREAALDSQVVAQLSQLGRQKAQSLNTDLIVFQPSEFSEKLMTFLRGGTMPESGQAPTVSRVGWMRLGEAVQPFFKRSPPAHFMYGAFTAEEKQKKVFNRRKRDPDDKLVNVPTKTPNTNVDTKKKESTTQEVLAVHKKLKDLYEQSDREPICLFEFITNPHSYGQTVENLFYTSFLIRDGQAKITLDNDKLPNIEPVGKVEGVDPSVIPKHQVNVTLSMQDWRDIIEAFKIVAPLIPTRARVYTEDDENANNVVPSSSKKEKSSASHPPKRSKPVSNGLHTPECNGTVDSMETEEETPASTSNGGKAQRSTHTKQKR